MQQHSFNADSYLILMMLFIEPNLIKNLIKTSNANGVCGQPKISQSIKVSVLREMVDGKIVRDMQTIHTYTRTHNIQCWISLTDFVWLFFIQFLDEKKRKKKTNNQTQREHITQTCSLMRALARSTTLNYQSIS